MAEAEAEAVAVAVAVAQAEAEAEAVADADAEADTGGLKCGGRGVWLGPPSSEGPPVVPAKGENFKASILLAPKAAPKQNFGFSAPNIGRGGVGGGGLGGGCTPPPPAVYGRSGTSLPGPYGPYLLQWAQRQAPPASRGRGAVSMPVAGRQRGVECAGAWGLP